jgi:hypothetical protein
MNRKDAVPDFAIENPSVRPLLGEPSSTVTSTFIWSQYVVGDGDEWAHPVLKYTLSMEIL